MVCNGCTSTVCMGMDCPELTNTINLIKRITGQLQVATNNLSRAETQKAGNSVTSRSGTSSPRLSSKEC
jgi:hypothetical protein